MQKKDTIQMRVSVPINFAFTTPFRQAGLIFSFGAKKKNGCIKAQRNHGLPCTTTTGRGIFFPRLLFAANGGRTGRTGKLYTAKEKKKNMLIEKAKKVKR